MARVDFFVQDDEMFVNEANTLPGFTSSIMYPKLWEASGLSQTDLMDKLIAHAFARLSHMRGLPYERLDSIDALGTDAMLDLLQTHDAWAVVDTAPAGPAASALSQACARAAVPRLVVHAEA